MGIIGFISFLVFVMTSTFVGLTLSHAQTFGDLLALENNLRALDIAQTSFYLVGTFALIPLAIFVKLRVNSDPILNVTSFSVLPLLLLQAIGTIVLTTINARVELALVTSTGSFKKFNGPAFDFASIMVEGWLQFLAILIICYFFVNVARWNRPNGKHRFQFTTFKASELAGVPPTAHPSTQDLVHN
ncbi:hypothetical protein M422DRAFT_49238 [Sphaerobolus stellatus SS14]|uniref:Unplaced genomic scaffold SPHSTscaffold_70, whole genome shotgun sequence n=1 Tax=Sphaerobolus stellatus (strain SS14) TaxID=990650 RepID=A0A0C9VQY5_SPHS4|nr:hypothetical protein M422DRAFT_49238 [Sphaerobolus stellatus SS14]